MNIETATVAELTAELKLRAKHARLTAHEAIMDELMKRGYDVKIKVGVSVRERNRK